VQPAQNIADGEEQYETLYRARLRQLQLLRRMEDFAARRGGCRHARLLAYFGQDASFDACGQCDRCAAL
jgi:superfamily II DNA helicase RecQ